jgi:hypothetical protein
LFWGRQSENFVKVLEKEKVDIFFIKIKFYF